MLVLEQKQINDELIIKKSKTNSRVYRESNIELLRFILALCVVFWHVGADNVPNNNWLFVNLNYITWLPVTTFALLTGYLSIKSDKNRFLKFLPIVVFYYLMNLAIGYPVIYYNDFGNRDQLKHIFTFGGRHWWYIWAILGTYLIAPGINFLVKNSNKWMSLVTIWILIITFFAFSGIQYSSSFSYQNVGILGIVYALGAWWKLHGSIFEKHKTFLLIGAACYILLFIIVSNIYFAVTGKVLFFMGFFMILIILGSLCLFLIFKEIKIKYNKVINYLGWLALPIYLFHYLGQYLVGEKIMNHIHISNLELQLLVFFLLVSFFTILLSMCVTFIEFYYIKLINFISSTIMNYFRKFKKVENDTMQKTASRLAN